MGADGYMQSNYCYIRQKPKKHPMSFTSLAAYPLSHALPFREPALDGHNIRQQMVATIVTTS